MRRVYVDGTGVAGAALAYGLAGMAILPGHTVTAGRCSCGCDQPGCPLRGALDPHRCWRDAAGPAWCNPPYGRPMDWHLPRASGPQEEG